MDPVLATLAVLGSGLVANIAADLLKRWIEAIKMRRGSKITIKLTTPNGNKIELETSGDISQEELKKLIESLKKLDKPPSKAE